MSPKSPAVRQSSAKLIQTFTVSPDSAVFPCSSFSATFQSVLAFSWTGFSHLYWSPEGSAFLLIFGGQSLSGNIPPLGNSGLITAEQRPPRQGLQAKSSQLPDVTHQVLLDHSHALWLSTENYHTQPEIFTIRPWTEVCWPLKHSHRE